MTKEEARQQLKNFGYPPDDEFPCQTENIIDMILYLDEHNLLNERMPEVEGNVKTVKMFINVFDTLMREEWKCFKKNTIRVKDIEKFIKYARGKIKEKYTYLFNNYNYSDHYLCGVNAAFKVGEDIFEILKKDYDEGRSI